MFGVALGSVLNWMGRRFSAPLPADVLNGGSMDLDEGVRQLETMSVLEDGIWAARMRHPDEPFVDQPAVPGRSWLVDVALDRSAGPLRFALRLACVSSSFSQARVPYSVPGVIKALSSRIGLSEALPIAPSPWELQSTEDLLKLKASLENPARTLPVILLTEPNQQEFTVKVAKYLLDGDKLADALVGRAHVVQVPYALAFEWSAMVGRQWSAYRGAVRTYFPGVNFEQGSPYEHPLDLALKIIFWRHGEQIAESAYETQLVERIALQCARKGIDWSGTRFFTDVRILQAQARRRGDVEKENWEEIYKEELAAKEEQVNEARRDYLEAMQLAEVYERSMKQAEAESNRLRFKVDALLTQLAEKTGEEPDAGIEMPEDYASLPEWVDRNLAGRLLLHPRAQNALKAAQYENLQLVCDALLLLANEYRNMRLATSEDGAERKHFDERRESLRLRIGGSIGETKAGQFDETYKVRYPVGSGDKYFLESHLRNYGNTRQPERCLAVYFFWHEPSRQVIVGWLPSHLENDLT
jgi:hypothetical protein